MCCSTVFWSAYVLMRILLILNFVLYITCPFSLTALRILSLSLVFPGGSVCQESTCNAGDLGLIPGSGSSLEKDMATHSRILAWRISWTEEPGGLQSMGSQRAGHDWATTSSPRHLFSVVWLGCAFMCFHVFFFLRFAKFFRSVGWWFSFMMENSWSWLLQLLLLLHPLPYFSEFPLTYGPPHAKSLQSCPTLCDPIGGSPQALPSLGFSRQEHWSGLPFPSPMQESEKWKWSRSVVSDSQWSHGLQPTRLLRPWNFPSKSTGVGCHCLLILPDIAPQITYAPCFFFPVVSHSGVDLEVFPSLHLQPLLVFSSSASHLSFIPFCVFFKPASSIGIFFYICHSFPRLLMIPSNFLNVWSVFSHS